MRIQLWSYNFAPEPTGIGPLTGAWARAMSGLGHAVEVVSAHTHYPEPRWGRRMTPYREEQEGVRVLRLPLWVGRATARERIRQELSYVGALTAALPALPTPDVIVAVSPSFPALGCAMVNARVRRVPWVLWLQDILPDGATATGLLEDGPLLASARAFERRAYRSAARIVTISDSFSENLTRKGVPARKLERIYNPASRPILPAPRDPSGIDGRVVLTMGNIGHTQNLVAVTEAFQASEELAARGAELVMAGDGVAGAAVRAAIATERITVTGVLDSRSLEAELRRSAVALVSQRYKGRDFNVPSKLMNFMGYGIPVVALVPGDSEVARIVRGSGAGWVCDSADPAAWARTIAAALDDPEEQKIRGEAGRRFAERHFAPQGIAAQFARTLGRVHGRATNGGAPPFRPPVRASSVQRSPRTSPAGSAPRPM
jgi:colanic acid biosynthesis glycosyl transferase WcaI